MSRHLGVWFFGSVALALLMGLALYLAPLHPNVVALQLTFTPDAFQAVLKAWGPPGVALFRSHLGLDCVLLLCYGVFGYLLARKTAVFSVYAPRLRAALAGAMPLAALCDAGENALHWQLTDPSVQAVPALYLVAGMCATFKLVLIAVFLAWIAHAMVLRRARR